VPLPVIIDHATMLPEVNLDFNQRKRNIHANCHRNRTSVKGRAFSGKAMVRPAMLLPWPVSPYPGRDDIKVWSQSDDVCPGSSAQRAAMLLDSQKSCGGE
jgi:hypothetical protein